MKYKKGHKHSPEIIAKLRKAGIKRVKLGFSLETRQKISNACKGVKNGFYGKKHSLKTIERMRIRASQRKGYKHSIETKQKIRLAHLGRPNSKEHNQNLSIAHKGKPTLYNRGEKNWNWKGGITSENKHIKNSIEYRLWRESVFARDGWTCQKCKIKGGNLHPHHILNFAEWKELRFAIDNGITLCKSCHIIFHKKYGRSKNTREQINKFKPPTWK